jgi:peptide/nickel transport system substrate-binding protein
MRTRIKSFAFAIAAALALPGLAAAQSSDKTQFVYGNLQFLTNFHPLIQVNNTKRQVIAYGLRPITAFDDKGNNVCVLCTELPSIEKGTAKIVDLPDGKKGMTVQFTLKPGLAWGDGKPVTTKDVEFTLKMARDPKIGFSNYNPWVRATSVDLVNDRTFVLHLPRVLASFASWDQILPEHIEGPIYAANPDAASYIKQSTYNRAPDTPGLWNGAFVLSEYRVGTLVVFTPNQYWPGPKPKLQRIALTYRENSAALVQNLLAGGIDGVAVSPGGISFSQMLDLRKQYPKRFTYHIANGDNLERIALNLDNPMLADVRVRRALMMAIDRKGITDALFDGLQEPADSLVSPDSALYNPSISKYPYDVAGAKKLLTEAGWKPGSDGICTNASGARLSFELVTTAGNQTRAQIAQVLQEMMKAVCVEITTKIVGLQEFNGNYARQRQFKGLMMSSIDFSPSTSPRIALGSDAVPSAANSHVGNNFSGYKNPEMDKALTALEGALNPDDAKKAWGDVQKYFTADLPMLPLYFYARAWVTVPDMRNFRQGTLDPYANWSEEWYRE